MTYVTKMRILQGRPYNDEQLRLPGENPCYFARNDVTERNLCDSWNKRNRNYQLIPNKNHENDIVEPDSSDEAVASLWSIVPGRVERIGTVRLSLISM